MKSLLFLSIGVLFFSCQSQAIKSTDSQKHQQTQQEEKIEKKVFFSEQKISELIVLNSHPGYAIYQNNHCQQCHGNKLQGNELGPPLLFELYKKGTHNKRRLHKSISLGSKKNHWPFGDMPAYPNLTVQEVDSLIDYIRDSIKANKI